MPYISNPLKHLSLVAFIVLPFLLPLPASADTIVPDTYIDDVQTWTLAQSPYLIPNSASADIMITASGTLNIEAGVVIKTNGARKFDVYGVLNILGAEGNPVLITLENDDGSPDFTINNSGRWGGFIFYPSSTGNLNYLQAKYTGFVQFPPGGPVIWNQGGNVTVNHSQFNRNFHVFLLRGGTTTVDHSLLDQNHVGFTFEGGDLSLTNSTISNSSDQSFISYGNANSFFARNNLFVNNRYNPFLNIAIDFDIASTSFIGGDVNAWRIGGSILTNKILPADTYALNGLIVESGGELTIEPGAIIKAQRGGYLIARGGILNMNGTKDNPIIFTSIADDSVGGDTNNDAATTDGHQFRTGGIQTETGGTANISHTFIKYGSGNAYIGPYNFAYGSLINTGGRMNVSNATIEEGNHTGVHHYSGTSTIENLLIQSGSYNNAIVYDFGELNVRQSSFQGPTSFYSLWNRENDGVPDVRFNYWGTPEGPYHPTQNATGTAAMIYGNALFIPFLTSPPADFAECCSSVLFIPGFMASDLYVQSDLSENQLWPPNSLLKSDVEKLMLNPIGDPITPGIYTKSPIFEAFGLNVYKSFIENMDNMIASGDIEEWLAFPYDWRKDIDEIVNNFTTIKKGDNFENRKLIDEAISLAQRSPTGKITIVGHSNGGLIGKELIKKLSSVGEADIVDKFVMIAMPQLGTPKTIASLLHGDQQVLLRGLLLDKELARQLGYDMQSAYNLLPSQKYFDIVADPVIGFQDSINQVFDYALAGFPQNISTYDDMSDFITSPYRGATIGEPTNVPNSLRSDLANSANLTINLLSDFEIPSSIKVYEIAGWGEDTIKGIDYRSKKENICSTQNSIYSCQIQNVWDRKLLMTRDGDGTVVIPSAINQVNTSEYYLNLFNQNAGFGINLKHHNILESSSALNLVSSIFTENLSTTSLPEYISVEKPIITSKSLQLSVHSPVSIEASDAQRKFTGVNTALSAEGFVFVKEEIPNSYYLEIADDKYIGLDEDGNYTIILQGNDVGTFTFDQEIIQDNNSIDSKSFINIPITPLTQATLNINGGILADNMDIDVNGDGTTDLQIQSSNKFNPIDYLNVMKFIIKSFGLEHSQETDLVVKIDNLIKYIQNGDIQKAASKAEIFVRKLNLKLAKIDEGESANRKLTEEEMLIVIQNLEEFILNLK